MVVPTGETNWLTAPVSAYVVKYGSPVVTGCVTSQALVTEKANQVSSPMLAEKLADL